MPSSQVQIIDSPEIRYARGVSLGAVCLPRLHMPWILPPARLPTLLAALVDQPLEPISDRWRVTAPWPGQFLTMLLRAHETRVAPPNCAGKEKSRAAGSR